MVQPDGETSEIAAVKFLLLTWLRQLQYMYKFITTFLSLSKLYITVIRKERFPAGKAKLLWEASLTCHTFF